MNIGPALISFLATNDTVTAVVGDRIYPEFGREQDKAFPLLIYKVETSAHYTNDGPSGLMYGTITVAAVGQSYSQADTAGSAILAAMNGYRGQWGDRTVQVCLLQDDGIVDRTENDQDTEEILYYIQEVTFDVAYQ